MVKIDKQQQYINQFDLGTIHHISNPMTSIGNSLTTSFNQVVADINSEAKTLRCLLNLRGLAANDANGVATKIEVIEAIVESLEQRFSDTEAFLDNEISCLDMLGDLIDKARRQELAITD